MIPLILGVAAGAVGTLAVSKMLSKDKNFYTTKEVADLLKISEYTVRKKIRDGELKAEPGKAYRISKDVLQEYMNNLHSAELLGHDNAEALSPEILARVVEVKQMDLKGLKLQLQKLALEVDEHDPKEFQKKKLALEIDINALEAEIKTYQLLNTISNSTSKENA